MIVDFHTHAFPDALAPRAIEHLSQKSGNMLPITDGTIGGLIANMNRCGVDRSVVLNIVTNPRQMHKVNDFAIAINGQAGRITAFGSVHPAAPDALDELCRLKEAGIKGIKLHPDYQGFFVDEERLYPIYEKAAALSMITVFHAGMDIGWYEPVHCTPQRLRAALPAFGSAPVVAAHMGGYLQWDAAQQYLCGTSVYLDTSFSYSRMPAEQAKAMIKTHGASRFLLGSDTPWSSPDLELRFVRSLGLSAEEEAAIAGGNALRLLGEA